MIEINGLYKSYTDEEEVVKDIHMKVEKGTIHGLIGHNGSGKTTIIKCVTGIYPPDRGEVLLGGEPVYENVKDTFDIIVSNPPIRAGKKIVFEILEKAYDHLNNQGELFIVIQKKQGAPSAKKKMEDVFGNCEIIKRDKGYFILKSVK